MKKWLKALPLLLIMVLITACSSNDSKVSKETESKAEESEKGIEVDKGLLNVEVTLPASFFEGEDLEKMIADAKEDGVKEVTQNADGSITYKMSKSQHKKMMKELKASVIETMDSLKSGEDFQSIKDVSYNNDFTDITLVVDSEAYENSFDSFAVFGIGLSTMMYQLFNGADPNNYEVNVNIKDEQTGMITDTIVLPEAFEDIEEDSE